MNATVVRNLAERLRPLLRSADAEVKISSLLRAYATFTDLERRDPEHLLKTYSEIRSTYPRYAVIDIPQNVEEGPLREISQAYLQYSLEEFLRFVVSDLVADVQGLLSFYHDELHSDILLLTHHINQIWFLLFNRDDARISKSDDVYHHGLFHPDNPTLLRLYRWYCDSEKNRDLRLKQKQFERIIKCIYVFPIDFNVLQIKPVGYKREDLDRLIDILGNQLELSRQQQIQLCSLFFVENKQAKGFQQDETVLRFFALKDSVERKKLFQKALSILAKIPPLDALAAISVRRRRSKRHGTHFGEQVYSPNDVPLENSLIYPLFTSTVGPIRPEEHPVALVTVLLPSVFFVRKWLADSMLHKQPVCFVLESSTESKLISYYFQEGSYRYVDKSNVTFTDLSTWRDQLQAGQLSLTGTKLLAFFCGAPVEEQSEIVRLLYDRAANMELTLLLGSYEFDQARSPFSPVMAEPRFCFRSIELLPQGINNSAIPRRKLLICAELTEQPSSEQRPIALISDELNVDLKTQAVVRGALKKLQSEPQDLADLDQSSRQIFREEILRKDSSGRERVPAFSMPFTPDLTIWCSKTYPKENINRPRLEAYFCAVTPPGKTERGFTARGEVLKQTRKHTTKLSDLEVPAWLLMEFPFSIVRRRRSRGKKELGSFIVSIREEAIDYYSEALSGENLAIKTFWYLYPNLEDLYSTREYELLSTMSKETEIGMLRVQDVTAADVERILESSFPNESGELLYRKFVILSTMMDKAVEYGFCDRNPLEQTIRDKIKRDKLFAQVRRALTKKHFTQGEFRLLYKTAAERLHQGRVEYIGILFRLLTGLGSNVVCGLKWKDLIAVKDYSINKLVITRQTTNDGSAYQGFTSLEDYLCFPCSDLLMAHLKEANELTKAQFQAFSDIGEWPIIRRSDEANRRGGQRAFAPRELERLCKELLSELKLPDRIVMIPDLGNGTKETNLNTYGGDFFRENFRFWTLRYAGMTNDETAYLIGNTPVTTFGRFYCDYLNDASQYLLYVKLRRLDAMLLSDEPDEIVSERFPTDSMSGIVRTGPGPASIQLQLNLPRNTERVELDIDSEQALSLLIAPVKERRDQT